MMQEAEQIYSTLLEANKNAFASQLFTVAYHALAGAMNCAVFMRDSSKLFQIERVAREQYEQLRIDLADRQTGVEFDLYLSLLQMAKTHLILSHRAQ